MYILAIETTGAAASVALINENGYVTVEESEERLNHLKDLIWDSIKFGNFINGFLYLAKYFFGRLVSICISLRQNKK